MKAVLYLRVSTRDQNLDNQERELREAAARMGHTIVHVYQDFGISGAKGRDQRPAFDRLHKAMARRDVDLVMAWSVDRLGRSLQDLVPFLMHLNATNTGLYLHKQGLDTTTPAGRALFQMLGVFAEFEREMIKERTAAGVARAMANGKTNGRPPIFDDKKIADIKAAYAQMKSLRKVATKFEVAPGTIRNVLAA